MTPSYTHILFDADDTLFDYKSAAVQVLSDTLGRFGIPCGDRTNELFQSINQPLWKKREQGLITLEELQTERFRLFLERLGAQGDPKRLNEYYLSRLAVHGRRMLPEAEETVARLSARYTLAIVTNGISAVQHQRFDDSPIAKYMTGIFVSGDMGLKKPDRAYFDRVLEELGSPARERVLIVGDSLTSDIRGGKNAGIKTCWFNPGQEKAPPELTPDITVSSLTELCDMLLI